MQDLYQKVSIEQTLQEETPLKKSSDDERELFYCPVYEGFVEDYDCSEICVGIRYGRFFNEGIPTLLDIDVALARKKLCFSCVRFPPYFQPSALNGDRGNT
jgi:hypothetical protein